MKEFPVLQIQGISIHFTQFLWKYSLEVSAVTLGQVGIEKLGRTQFTAKQFSKNVVLDPCCGWGGRMLGAVTAGKRYIGFEPNEETYNNLIRLAHFLGIENRIDIYNDGAENMHSYDFETPDFNEYENFPIKFNKKLSSK